MNNLINELGQLFGAMNYPHADHQKSNPINYHQLEALLNNEPINTNVKFNVRINTRQNKFVVYANKQVLIEMNFNHGQRDKGEGLNTNHDDWLTLRQYLLLDYFERESRDDQVIINNLFDDPRINYNDVALYTYFQHALGQFDYSDKTLNKQTIKQQTKMPNSLFNYTFKHLMTLNYLVNPKPGKYHLNDIPYQEDELITEESSDYQDD